MRFRPVLGPRLATPDALFNSRNYDALRNVCQIYWGADAALEDREVGSGKFAHSKPVRFERIRQRRNNRDGCGRASGLWFVDHGVPDGTLKGQSFPGEVPPADAANFALSQSGERRK